MTVLDLETMFYTMFIGFGAIGILALTAFYGVGTCARCRRRHVLLHRGICSCCRRELE